MPELPEVEYFRQLLLPLKDRKLQFSVLGDSPPRKWLTEEETAILHNGRCVDVLRRGKQICMIINQPQHDSKAFYLYLHMGMTGRICIPNQSVIRLENVKAEKDGVFPPRYTYLLISGMSDRKTNTAEDDHYQAAFSDSRKFGSCHLSQSLEIFNDLAPDAHEPGDLEQILPQVTGQVVGIKALLLDQKRVLSGVGNWVADEVLYQCGLHPDQMQLTEQEGRKLLTTLREILQTAIDCLKNDMDYPSDWLFGYRWTKKKAGKDSHGRAISFLTSGGRTSAIVASVQKLQSRKREVNVRRQMKRKRANEEESVKDILPSAKSNEVASFIDGKQAKLFSSSQSPAILSSSDDGIIAATKPKRSDGKKLHKQRQIKRSRGKGSKSQAENNNDLCSDHKDALVEVMVQVRRSVDAQSTSSQRTRGRQNFNSDSAKSVSSVADKKTGLRRSPRFT